MSCLIGSKGISPIYTNTMKKAFIIFWIFISSVPLFALNNDEEQALKDNFLKGWTFWSDTHSQKEVVTLPHDAMLTEVRQADLKDGRHSGFFPGNIYHYEKALNISKSLKDKHFTIKFGGVYHNATISINGKAIATHKYGWTPFSVSLDGYLKVGKNIIRVDADNSQVPNCRWYTGAGIYRPVHLVIQNKTHIDDVRVLTTTSNVSIKTSHNGGKVYVAIYDGKKKVTEGNGDDISLKIPNAKLWSADSPNLYKAVVTLKNGEKTVDTYSTEFGMRQITWSHDRGLMVNGKAVKLRGGCLHSDNGILGAVENDEAAIRKIAIMKQFGYNAIRSAHNPCSDEILRACDKLGMYVMDELWDVWYDHKTTYDYATDFKTNYASDVEAMVDKDYNHPSVIMYSIANEPTEVGHHEGVEMSKDIVNRLHDLDSSRPVTAGINLLIAYIASQGQAKPSASGRTKKNRKISSERYNVMMASMGEAMMDGVRKEEVDSTTKAEFVTLDIAGYNYGNRRYELDAQDNPSRIIVGTETFPFTLAENWAKVESLPYLIGDFQWTAWDYIGEVGVGAWYNSDEPPTSEKTYPWLLSGTGALDLLGNPTGEALLAKAIWLHDDKPYIAVQPVDNRPLVKAAWRGTNSIPSWSWQGSEGIPAKIEVYTSAKSVELYLNDKLIGSEPVKNYVAQFSVPYQPGTLKAVTISADGIKHEAKLTSASGDLMISVEKETYSDKNLIFADINIVGSNGEVESKADRELTVKVDGGELLGFGSAQPKTEDRFTSGSYTTYFGKSQAIIRPGKGKVTITVSGEGLPTVKNTL